MHSIKSDRYEMRLMCYIITLDVLYNAVDMLYYVFGVFYHAFDVLWPSFDVLYNYSTHLMCYGMRHVSARYVMRQHMLHHGLSSHVYMSTCHA